MNGKKAKHVRRLLVAGNKPLLEALARRYGDDIIQKSSFNALYKKAKQLFKDIRANKPI